MTIQHILKWQSRRSVLLLVHLSLQLSRKKIWVQIALSEVFFLAESKYFWHLNSHRLKVSNKYEHTHFAPIKLATLNDRVWSKSNGTMNMIAAVYHCKFSSWHLLCRHIVRLCFYIPHMWDCFDSFKLKFFVVLLSLGTPFQVLKSFLFSLFWIETILLRFHQLINPMMEHFVF